MSEPDRSSEPTRIGGEAPAADIPSPASPARPAAPTRPSVLAAPGSDAVVPRVAAQKAPQSELGPLARAGLWLRDRARALLPRAAAPAQPSIPEAPDDSGRVTVPSTSHVDPLPRVPGQPEALSYSLVYDGLPVPPGAVGYLVEHPAGFVVGSRAGNGTRPERVSVVAYIDAYGRVFSAGSFQAVPPARTPDVQFKHYVDRSARAGCIEVAVGRGHMARLAEYAENPDGSLTIVGSRVELGNAARTAGLPLAAAVAFLALWLFPRNEGVSLASVSVKETLGHLRTSDLFEALDALDADARQGEGHPLLLPPGILAYTARNLREAGLVNLKASDLAEHDPFAAGGPAAPTPFLSLLGGPRPTGVGDLMAAMRAAFEASGVPGLAVLGEGIAEPRVRLVRTSAYANAFYVGFDRRQVSVEGARKLLEAESLLNRFVLMVGELDRVGAVQSATVDQVAQLDAWVVDSIADAARPYLDGAVPSVTRASTGSPELDVRLTFARGCESLRLPYRLEYAFRVDLEAATLVVDVECPSAVLMPREAWDAETGGWRVRGYAEREGLATRYALHLMGVVAAVAFWAGEGVLTVGVNCWHGFGSSAGVDELMARDDGSLRGTSMNEPSCVASAVFERGSFLAVLATQAQREGFSADPFALVDSAAHALALDADGHLGQVRPLLDLEDPGLHPADADLRPELDSRALTPRGSALLHAKEVCDLGIYENTVRKTAADEVVEAFNVGGDLAALDAVKDIHDRTENRLMRDACLRVSEGIANGAYTGDSKAAIAEAFSDIYGLQAAMNRAAQALRTNPEAARVQLEAMVAAVDERGWFADTPTRRYRYFDSYAARAIYSARCPEAADGRELRLMADEYYLAHYRLATLLADSLDHVEEAIAHARRCVEVAPSVAAGHLRLARCYFCTFDYRSEIGALREVLRVAWSPNDVGVALYWLAYAFCMTDDYDAGFACYGACSRYDASLAEAAVAEMADFAARRSVTPRTLDEREERQVLAAVGIDLAAVDANVEFLVKAAGAVADVRSYGLARNLLSSAEMALHDDAMPPVLESLEE